MNDKNFGLGYGILNRSVLSILKREELGGVEC